MKPNRDKLDAAIPSILAAPKNNAKIEWISALKSKKWFNQKGKGICIVILNSSLLIIRGYLI